MNKSNFLINQCQHTLNSFKKEEADDNQQRQKYRNDFLIINIQILYLKNLKKIMIIK